MDFSIYTVQRTDGERLWVVWGSVKGFESSQRGRAVSTRRSTSIPKRLQRRPGNSAASRDPWEHLGSGRRSTTRRSPTSTRPSGSSRRPPLRTSAGARPGARRRSTTRRSPITTRPSGSIPRTPWLHRQRRTPGSTSRSTTRRSPIPTRPSGSIPLMPVPSDPRRMPGGKARARQGDRRLQRGHPARSQDAEPTSTAGDAWQEKKEYEKAIADYSEAIRLEPKYAVAYYDRGDRLVGQEGVRQGDRRPERGHSPRSRECQAYRPGQRLGLTRRSTTRRSPTSTRPSGSIPEC